MIKAALLGGAALLAAVVAQSASAADLGVITKAPFVAAPVSHWDGLYASVSAGGTWTRTDYSRFSNAPNTNSNSIVGPGVLDSFVSTSNTSIGESATESEKGAVFTFTMGYNLVYSSWLFGIQSEVSRNLSNTRLTGTRATTITSASTPSLFFGPGGSGTSVSTAAFETNLRNQWTVSEMARIGFLPTRDWLVYGLVGWSWAGFDLGEDPVRPLTLNGITYGAGVERDFGWLRAFVQFKAIDYRSKDIVTSNGANSTFSGSSFIPGATQTSNSTTTGADTRRVSAHVNTVTAGITMPINFSR